ncbi:MAG: redoxin domain-containing protein [Vicinamibacterales bacterium]
MRTVGSAAPEFSLRSHTGETVSLRDFRGKKHVVLAFHPLAFTPVCSVQMQTYEKDLAKYNALDAHILSLSVDAGPAKKAWAESLGGISFDLLADFHPHGHVASLYGVMREDGISERATFIIDKTGTIVWARKYDIPQQPDHGEVLEQLGKM